MKIISRMAQFIESPLFLYIVKKDLIQLVFFLNRMPNQIRNLNFNDTFLNVEHLKASFPQYSVKVS